MIKIDLIKKKNYPYKKLHNFLTAINNDYPIHLNEKIKYDSFLQKIKQNGEIICAIDENKIVGCIFFYANNFKEKIAFITLLGVLKEYRNQSIATRMLKKMIEYCKGNFKRIHLYTHSTNDIAIQFYKKNQFHLIECDRVGDLKLELKLEEV